MRRNNIILDLDNTIISCITNNQKNSSLINSLKDKITNFHELTEHNITKYIIYERNKLKVFLDYIFEHFNVSIWTAATRRYTAFVMEKILKNKKIDYVFFDYHVNLSKKLYDNNMKHLDLLTNTFKLNNFNYENTLIIDNLDKIANNNMPYKSYRCKTFNIVDQINTYDNDDEFLRIIDYLSTNFNTPSLNERKLEEPKLEEPKLEPKLEEPKLEPKLEEQKIKEDTSYDNLPEGWRKVESRSRKGEFSYENIYTEERIPEIPKYEASRHINKSRDLEFYD